MVRDASRIPARHRGPACNGDGRTPRWCEPPPCQGSRSCVPASLSPRSSLCSVWKIALGRALVRRWGWNHFAATGPDSALDSAASAACVRWQLAPQVTYATGPAPSAVAIGDFNGDGSFDLVVANLGNQHGERVAQRRDGTFAPQGTYATGTSPYSLVVSDLNGDGKSDFAVANYGAGAEKRGRISQQRQRDVRLRDHLLPRKATIRSVWPWEISIVTGHPGSRGDHRGSQRHGRVF